MADPATTEDVFTTDQPSETQSQEQPTGEQQQQASPEPMAVPQEVNDLVGDGKKYRDVQSALSSIKPAQEHIQRLEDDNKELRSKITQLESDLQARESVKSVLDKLGNKEGSEQQGSLDPEAIEQLVYGALEKRETVTTAQQNVKTVNDTLLSKYGEKARETVAKRATELGMSVEDLQSLASRSPKAVLAYFDTQQSPSYDAQPSKTNPSALDSSKTAPTGGKSWEEIRQELRQKHGIQG